MRPRHAHSLAVILLALACVLAGVACDAGDDDGEGADGPSGPAIPSSSAAAEGPALWATGEAVVGDWTAGFVLRRIGGAWLRTDLDLPYDSVSLYALAPAGASDPWLAGEGLTDADAGTYETFVYRVGRGALRAVDAPRADLAITAICPQGPVEAWAVGAVRMPLTFAGYAGFFDGDAWSDRTPAVDEWVERWNLSAADFPEPDRGAALGLVSGEETGQGIVGALFVYDAGDWTDVPLPFDPQTDVYVFTDIRYEDGDVRVAGRANLAGWIGHYDESTDTWTAEDLSAFDRTPMWEINSVAGDGAGTRYALGSEDVDGLSRALVLADDGAGWREIDSPPGALAEPKHLQPRDAAFLSPRTAAATVSEYYFGIDDSRQRDRLWVLDEGAWIDATPEMAEDRYEFRAIAAVRAPDAP